MKNSPIHPGEILRTTFLRPLGVSVYRLAKDTGLAQQRLRAVVSGKRSITAETDLYLCWYFSLDPGYWLTRQAQYDIAEALKEYGEQVKATVKPLEKTRPSERKPSAKPQ